MKKNIRDILNNNIIFNFITHQFNLMLKITILNRLFLT